MKKAAFLAAVCGTAILLLAPQASSLYFESGNGSRCASCHEMKAQYDRWHASSHKGVSCAECHGGAKWQHANRAIAHVTGDLPEQFQLANADVQEMTDRCRTCHRQEHAAWSRSPHRASYSRIFTDTKHNSKLLLMEDCLRCHGMHYEGGISDVVLPVSRTEPWRLVRPELAQQPSMPCLACHDLHREGKQSLAFFDRRSRQHIPLPDLQIPSMLDGTRPVKMSPDPRQGLCYQCHAAAASRQIFSGDDRTPVGVHEGISCLACHNQHDQSTKASCASCHPKMSNCRLDVEKMDTTYASKTSKHDIHRVKCNDCHDGVHVRLVPNH